MQGRYYLRASDASGSRAIVYHPAASKFLEAEPIDVTPGSAKRGLILRLRHGPLSRVRSTVRSPLAGGRIVQVKLSLGGKDPVGGFQYEQPSVDYDADGHFTFQPSQEGTYVISGEIGVLVAGRTRLFGVEEPVAAKGPITTVPSMRLMPYALVDGIVRREGSFATLGKLLVFLSCPDRYFPAGPIDQHGSFHQELLPGTYRVSASYSDSNYYTHAIQDFRSVRFNGKAVTDRMVEVPPTGGKLEVTIAPNGSRIQGVVRDVKGAPVAGAFVAIWGDKPLDVFVTTSADVLGRFEMDDLPAGACHAAAWEAVDYGLAESAEFRSVFANRTVAVTVRTNLTVRADLVASPLDAALAEAAKLK